MRHVRTALLIFIAGILLLIAHGSTAPSPAPAPVAAAEPAPVPVSAPAPIANAPEAAEKKTGDCTAPAPRPLLQKDAYSAYSFAFGPENTSVEKASTGTTRVEIQTSGCYDGVEHGFLFEDGNPLADYTSRDHWLAWAGDQLKSLKTYRRAQDDVKDLLAFLAAAPGATARMNGSELRLEVCRDHSAPTEDGCSFESGGGWRFAVRQISPQRVGVFLSRYYALKGLALRASDSPSGRPAPPAAPRRVP
jgi:hypothetical protein